ncbi:MAG: thiolase family protein [Vicinamibacterales bacterium]|mgnify:FL=1|jgi:acetyl-CoA acetyltransferase family protein|nr:acetyl-CoA acetyltransferase [Acidobacteriota bacterium]MDP7295096.1 thiolase family protein [Vicinamibacterales bacterium]MDP7478016.1 thiolase family protein [Vicinamibacterales bacterium]MDP7670556.1 thiolase family protein [Vicinamibacterales bacterium]HJO38213.1 thiolase family protein [Vicinamibacterales bacterium]|tara:strand:- start:1233 stop:2426 length:1194 start_codon:yes stop_codon:yes gene_type:complete
MPLERIFIPYGAYWSTPFCKWQGRFAGEHSMKLAASVARRAFDEGCGQLERLDGIVLGTTVMQPQSFYGAPWLAGMIGADGLTGPTISQACATSAAIVASAALQIEAGQRGCVLAVACDRTSNGPHVYYPNPSGPGALGEAENPVWDNFNRDPFAGNAMLETAENVAREAGITREEQDAMALLRSEQYQAALADDRAFQKRYMMPVVLNAGKKSERVVDRDEGVFGTTADGLARLKPVLDGGTVTYGTQTYPADGNAGVVLCDREAAEHFATRPGVSIQVLGFGSARAKKGFMPMAVVPAARQALDDAGVAIADCAAVKTHNPFAVNDVYLCRELVLEPAKVNRYGSPLVFGHPQAPTGLRAMIELIEELVERGGGLGLFSGCAAGDTAMAVVFRVG